MFFCTGYYVHDTVLLVGLFSTFAGGYSMKPKAVVLHVDAIFVDMTAQGPRFHGRLPELFDILHAAKVPVYLIGEMRLLTAATALSKDDLFISPDTNNIQGQILEIRWSATPPLPESAVWYLDVDPERRHAAHAGGAYAFGRIVQMGDVLNEFVTYLHAVFA